MRHALDARAWAIVVCLSAALCAVGSGVRAQQTNRETMYFPLGSRAPKGLADFQAFGLTREAAGNRAPRWAGWVMTDRGDPEGSTSTMTSVRVAGKRLRFAARTRAGVTFAFDGRFLQRGDLSRYYGKRVAVVEGTVRKTRGGKKVAQGRMRFVCGVGG